jgi:hypothetical protein
VSYINKLLPFIVFYCCEVDGINIVDVCVHKLTALARITPLARSQQLNISNGASPTIKIEAISKILLRS